MGQRGPKKTPAAVKQARGTYRPDRDAEEVEFEAEAPPKPDNLHDVASAEWDRLTPLLMQKGLLTSADWIAWQLGFAAYDTFLDASEQLAKEGYTFNTGKGYICQHPLVSVVGKAWNATLKFCQLFGLTPSARSGLKIGGDAKKGEDPLQALIDGRNG